MAKRKPTPDDPLASIVEALRPLAVPIDSIAIDPANARQHAEADLLAIGESLRRYGQRTPLVVNRATQRIEKGNGTWAAARRLGWTQIAALFVDDDPATATGYAIADNRTAELSLWDQEKLAAALEQADFGEAGLAESLLLAELTDDPEEVDASDLAIPDPRPAGPRTKAGEIWRLGEHRLTVGEPTKECDDILQGWEGRTGLKAKREKAASRTAG